MASHPSLPGDSMAHLSVQLADCWDISSKHKRVSLSMAQLEPPLECERFRISKRHELSIVRSRSFWMRGRCVRWKSNAHLLQERPNLQLSQPFPPHARRWVADCFVTGSAFHFAIGMQSKVDSARSLRWCKINHFVTPLDRSSRAFKMLRASTDALRCAAQLREMLSRSVGRLRRCRRRLNFLKASPHSRIHTLG